jgi:hypothetical protein
VAENLFGAEVPATVSHNDNSPYTLGTRFTPAVSGTVTHIRWYVPTNPPTGTTTFLLFRNSDEAQIGSATQSLAGLGAQWVQVAFAAPVAVTAGQSYTAAVFIADHYVSTTPYSWPKSNGANLSTPAPGGYFNGNFAVDFPDSTFNNGCYFADVVFEPASSGVASVGRTTLAASPRSAAIKVVAIVGRCVAAVRPSAAARKAAPSSGRAVAAITSRAVSVHRAPGLARTVAASSTSAATKHAAVASARATIAPSAIAATVRKTPASATATVAATVLTTGAAKPAVARCSFAATARASVSRINRATGSTTAATTARAATIRRTPVTGRTATPSAARAVGLKRVATAGRVVAAIAATAQGEQAEGPRPVAGRCVAAFTSYRSLRRITLRPSLGVTIRPSDGLTPRPFAGITPRP